MTACLETILADYDSFFPKESVTTIKKNEYECDCGGSKLFGPDGLPVCSSCGAVDDMYIDDSPEWISGINEDGSVSDPARCGAPLDLALFSAQWGTGSMINTRGSSYAVKKIARINFHSSMNHRDRSLFHAYKDIDMGASPMHVPEAVVREAKILYRKFNEMKLTRGAVRTGIKANCVLYACKLNKIPRTTKEVADAFGIPTKDISRTSDMFEEMFLGTPKEDEPSEITKPSDVISRLINNFNITDKRNWRMKCVRYADSLTDCVQLMGKAPKSVASVVIYKVLGDLVSKKEIVEKCEISEPTMNKIEKIVNKYLEDKN
jgi:transcription initiation factor TFIIB